MSPGEENEKEGARCKEIGREQTNIETRLLLSTRVIPA